MSDTSAFGQSYMVNPGAPDFSFDRPGKIRRTFAATRRAIKTQADFFTWLGDVVKSAGEPVELPLSWVQKFDAMNRSFGEIGWWHEKMSFQSLLHGFLADLEDDGPRIVSSEDVLRFMLAVGQTPRDNRHANEMLIHNLYGCIEFDRSYLGGLLQYTDYGKVTRIVGTPKLARRFNVSVDAMIWEHEPPN